jgi:hypothetical protein|tara:strand:+ start:1307 stop:1450 length:144 start_codon:yes stop_codon:yes gene_type:complete
VQWVIFHAPDVAARGNLFGARVARMGLSLRTAPDAPTPARIAVRRRA